jgi:hypothetical protein
MAWHVGVCTVYGCAHQDPTVALTPVDERQMLLVTQGGTVPTGTQRGDMWHVARGMSKKLTFVNGSAGAPGRGVTNAVSDRFISAAIDCINATSSSSAASTCTVQCRGQAQRRGVGETTVERKRMRQPPGQVSPM